MGLVDVFGKEDRVEITFSEFYSLMKEAAKAELVMNAVHRGVPHTYIMSMADGPGVIGDKLEGES